MIPWDTFKTPQDAYEWAAKNITNPITLQYFGPGDFLLFGSVRPFGMQFICRLGVRR